MRFFANCSIRVKFWWFLGRFGFWRHSLFSMHIRPTLAILYYTILNYTILYLYYTIPYLTILYYTSRVGRNWGSSEFHKTAQKFEKYTVFLTKIRWICEKILETRRTPHNWKSHWKCFEAFKVFLKSLEVEHHSRLKQRLKSSDCFYEVL